jgi:hypothetical protein
MRFVTAGECKMVEIETIKMISHKQEFQNNFFDRILSLSPEDPRPGPEGNVASGWNTQTTKFVLFSVREYDQISKLEQYGQILSINGHASFSRKPGKYSSGSSANSAIKS